MIIDDAILDDLTEKAKASPRLRMHYDLRNSPKDKSQRLLNAIEPGTIMPIHRHNNTSETVICIRGHYVENLYDKKGQLIESIDMLPGGVVVNVPAGQWHNLESKENGTVLMEFKDGVYEPLKEDEIWKG